MTRFVIRGNCAISGVGKTEAANFLHGVNPLKFSLRNESSFSLWSAFTNIEDIFDLATIPPPSPRAPRKLARLLLCVGA
jgi:hypothetical protein